MRLFYVTVLVLLSAGISVNAAADVLQVPDESPRTRDSQPMEMPGRGMHMDKVRAQFGEPREIMPAIGEPPITRWIYDGYTVYFEYSYVIQSVTHLNSTDPLIYSVDVNNFEEMPNKDSTGR